MDVFVDKSFLGPNTRQYGARTMLTTAELVSKSTFRVVRGLRLRTARGGILKLSSTRSFCTGSNDETATNQKQTANGGDPTDQVYDVTIAGGGMVGTAMACALGFQPVFEGKRILMLEGGTQQKIIEKFPENYSNRVCALTPGTVKLLEDIGAWEHILGARAQPLKRMQVWDSCSDSSITFDRENMSEDLAHIVENSVTVNALLKQLDSLQGRVEVRYRAKIGEIQVPLPDEVAESPYVKVHLDDDSTIETKLLIGADGPGSYTRQSAGIRHINWNYDQSAVVATLQLAEPTENIVAWQRFLPTGPIALLPLTNSLSSLVWSTTPDNAEDLLLMPSDQFVDSINKAFWEEEERDSLVTAATSSVQSLLASIVPGGLPAIQLPPTISGVDADSRAMFPLSLGHSVHYVKPRVALIGDAAHRVHPLAGQGANLGFGDVACLRDVLVAASRNGQDLGSLSCLLEYETLRQRQVIPVMTVIDSLHRLYATRFMPAVLARSVGLQTTNALQPLKKLIVNYAAN